MASKERARAPGSIEVGVWLRLLGCTNIILRHLRRNLKDAYGLTMPRFDLLAQVARPPRGPSLSALSRRLLVTKGNITDIVARLEAAKLVERRRDDADGRIQYVFLTAAGRKLWSEIQPVHDRWLTELMGELSREELDALYKALGILKAALKRADARMSPPDIALDGDEETGLPVTR